MSKHKNGFSAVIVILVVLLVGALGAAGYFFLDSQGYSLKLENNDNEKATDMMEDDSKKESEINEPTPTNSVVDEDEVEETGYIEGSTSYPSEFLPDQTVCADNLDTNETICTETVEDEKYTYGKGYLLEVPAGTYNVYAKYEGQKIYYNEFVTCGLNINCPSHDPIDVVVEAGATATDVDPQDWYDN